MKEITKVTVAILVIAIIIILFTAIKDVIGY